MKYDYLIVGSGLYGAVFAQQAKKHGKKVLVIDKRNNIAGNIYTEEIERLLLWSDELPKECRLAQNYKKHLKKWAYGYCSMYLLG